MDLGLQGSCAVVSGGTKGIGRAIALMLAEEGANVAVCSRSQQDVADTVEVLTSKGVQACGSALDVSKGDAVKQWVEKSAETLGGLDIVVPNVSALATENTNDSWRKAFEIDLMHTVHMVDAAMPYLEKSKSGSIVVIASISGIEIDFFAGPYGATKGQLIHYAKGLACQLAPKGIRANSVSPGNTYFEGGVWPMVEENMPDLFEQALALNKTGRMATAEEVANGAVFLASTRASFITGTNLVVDGAVTNRVG